MANRLVMTSPIDHHFPVLLQASTERVPGHVAAKHRGDQERKTSFAAPNYGYQGMLPHKTAVFPVKPRESASGRGAG
jgi:hypothetical protein